jgi:hypothetical protein
MHVTDASIQRSHPTYAELNGFKSPYTRQMRLPPYRIVELDNCKEPVMVRVEVSIFG